ncbi:hypothetical protein EB796_007889 [Bugula neritina]|uniref:Uncharacterized protein n=1 Tax=Bugula neritina TaxID=10212 RepID=A0A7J7K597_BUGNE|nr:hypothetical protein EB796_007889 [Bugula neritina]
MLFYIQFSFWIYNVIVSMSNNIIPANNFQLAKAEVLYCMLISETVTKWRWMIRLNLHLLLKERQQRN